MATYARFLAGELPKSVGEDAPGGRRKSDGRDGHICHGPYITLSPGRYTAGFYVQRQSDDGEGKVHLEVTADHGARTLAERTTQVHDLFRTTDGLLALDISVQSVERDCELRLHVSTDARIEVTEAVLFRTDLPGWGAR